MEIVLYILIAIVIINALAAIVTVFRTQRDIAATWAWLLVLTFIPVFGFIIYAFFGRRLPKSSLLRLTGSAKKQVKREIKQQKKELGHFNEKENPNNKIVNDSRGLVEMFMNNGSAPLLNDNEIKTYTGGKEFIAQFFEDIRNAKHTINIEFYTFYADKIGHQALDLLVQKAKEGVDVRVIYDAWGSMGTTQKFFKPLFDAGGRAFPFLHNKLNVRDMRVNFRDHHKIVTIDGEYGYIGGLNLGDQYMGWKPKFGNWRDCMIRVHGHGVYGLQSRFLLDWNGTDENSQIDPNDENQIKKYYPKMETNGNAIMQIVSSGPDSAMEQIKMGYIKMIGMAKESIKITTPYLIPDDSVFTALKIAAKSGVKVEIVTPDMPDHPFVYRATQYYSRQLTKLGIKIYAYNNGFMHAKTIVVDGKLVSVGSANMDYRSFELNFECNAFVYDEKLAKEMEKIYAENIADSTLQTEKIFSSQSKWLDFKQHFSRLLSPLL
ncbi:cardiolipin synthase [Fructilactobacillus sp. Tb1]|uniref:cardiolipin synthase n=1 Tax=Fructilactobacillus sp. Tb1 TaxID=3422304 RepID=UPI003D2AD966